MSISLVKKSLELFTVDQPENVNFQAHSKRKDKKCRSKKSNKIQKDEKKTASLLVQKIREKSRKSSEINTVDVNVQRLLNLSKSNGVKRKQELKLLEKVNKKKKADDDTSKESLTAFTEEDFEQFQKEYFAND